MMLRRAALPLAILTGLALFATPAAAATVSVSIEGKVRWSSALSTPASRNFDVQIKRPGQSVFHAFRRMTTALKAFFNPAKVGTYKFRARTRITSSGMTSGFSPVLTLSIS
jgi:hypothetical protein